MQKPAPTRILGLVKEKWCSKGAHWVPHDAEHFGRNRTKPDKMQTYCKVCMRKLCRRLSSIQRDAEVRKRAERSLQIVFPRARRRKS